MSNMVSSLEQIREDLKAKIEVKIAELPESQALKRIEAAIEEIHGVMAMVGGLGIGALAVAAAPAVEEVAAVEEIAEAEAEEEVAETSEEEVAEAEEEVAEEEVAEAPEAEIVAEKAPAAKKSIIDEDALAADIFADEPVKVAKAA